MSSCCRVNEDLVCRAIIVAVVRAQAMTISSVADFSAFDLAGQWSWSELFS